MRLLKISILLYVLTIILSAKKCGRREPPPPPAVKNAQERGYFQVQGVGWDLCGVEFDKQSRLDILVSIYVTDPSTGKPILWVSPSAYPNPAKYTKSDLRNFRLYNNCIFSAVPGDKPFDVQIRMIGDCCKNYGECTTNGVKYWRRSVFEGNAKQNVYEDIFNKGYIVSLPVFATGKGEDNGDAPCRQ